MHYKETYADRVTHENRALKRRIELLESEDSIHRLKSWYEAVIRGKDDKIKSLKEGWSNCLSANRDLKMRNTKLRNENLDLQRRIKQAESRAERAQRDKVYAESRLETVQAKEGKCQEQHKRDEETIRNLKAENAALKDRISELEAQKKHDGTTSGIPTSQTPRDKKKVIPNTREKSGRKKGGQPGREKKEMEQPSGEEVKEEEKHEETHCPECGGELEEMEELEPRYEVDYEVRVIKRKHRFFRYKCRKCGKIIESRVPLYLKAKSQYGVQTQAMILALLDLGFVSVGRARELMAGLMGEENLPSHGYVGKVQKKAARMLNEFREEVRKESLRQSILHWDDTVVFMDTKRGCFRFYGNKKLALYYAHAAKDAKGIEADGILNHLTSATTLMHDHLKYNYRKEFLFQNIECIQHLERDLQKNSNDTGHKWSTEAKDLIKRTIHKRKEYLKEGKTEFSSADTNEFENELVRILTKGREENRKDKSHYYSHDEEVLIERIEKYESNYFAWVYDFELPTTNNLAESSLRMIKTKMKVSGQFLNEKTADEFALVRTYMETCRRNGKEIFEALRRLMSGEPYTLEEVLSA